MKTERMVRPRLRLVGGVCAGFAAHTGLPVAAVRTTTLLLALCGGAGALLYAWLWALTPSAASAAEGPLPHVRLAGSVAPGHEAPGGSAQADAASARSAPVTEILLGVALLAAGGALVAVRLGADIPLDFVIPAIVVLAGTALAWRQFADIRSGAVQRSSALLVRALGALVLVAVGILLFFVTGQAPNAWTVIVAAASVLLGVAVVSAPWLIRLTADLAEERAARVREAERAEIAAHLHDSVLQTLALIQQKAGPHSDAARLARAQERELREWLFTGAGAAPVDLAAELRRIAAVIEQDFAVRFDVVTAGPVLEDAPEPLVAAAREAMLNAARHAGGTVSLYLETGAGGTELSITDRGPGFTLSDIPDDRMGVRESILGRMRRVGGTATVRPGPGGAGTEIVLRLPPAPATPAPAPARSTFAASPTPPAPAPAPTIHRDGSHIDLPGAHEDRSATPHAPEDAPAPASPAPRGHNA